MLDYQYTYAGPLVPECFTLLVLPVLANISYRSTGKNKETFNPLLLGLLSPDSRFGLNEEAPEP